VADDEALRLMADYRSAYETANGKPFPGSLSYEHGWFVMRQPYTVRYRRKQIRNFIGVLRARASIALMEKTLSSTTNP
jgi:hypothetical protein